jgi:hypothetical protein
MEILCAALREEMSWEQQVVNVLAPSTNVYYLGKRMNRCVVPDEFDSIAFRHTKLGTRIFETKVESMVFILCITKLVISFCHNCSNLEVQNGHLPHSYSKKHIVTFLDGVRNSNDGTIEAYPSMQRCSCVGTNTPHTYLKVEYELSSRII